MPIDVKPGQFLDYISPPPGSKPEADPVNSALIQFKEILEKNPEFLEYMRSANPNISIDNTQRSGSKAGTISSAGQSSKQITNQLVQELGKQIYQSNNKDSFIQSDLIQSLSAAALANKLAPVNPPGGLTGLFPSLGDYLADKATPKKK